MLGEIPVTIVRLILVFTLVAAAIPKLLDVRGFTLGVLQYRAMPDTAVLRLAPFIPRPCSRRRIRLPASQRIVMMRHHVASLWC